MIKVFNQLKINDVYQMIYAFGEKYDNYLITEQVKVKVVEMCTSYTAEELYTKEFSKLNDIIFNYLKEMQELHQSNLTITHVLVEKLILPKEVMEKYEQVGTQKASLEAEIQSQLRKMKEEETISKISKIKAMASADQKIIAAENEAQLVLIYSDANSTRKRIEAETNANITTIRTKAEVQSIEDLSKANKLKYTNEYIQLEAIKAWGNISKVYFGNSIPNIILNPLRLPDII